MKNHLIVIGIDDYIHHQKLSTCKKDIIDFKNILLEKYGFYEPDVIELINEKATNKSIQDSLSGLVRKLQLDDNLIIFFSGHGHYFPEKERGFWIPYDGTSDYTTWLANETIIAIIQKMKCRHLFLISDSCFSYSLLNTDQKKSDSEYAKRPSRWALTSAFDEAYAPRDPNVNSLFAKSVINFLEEAENDFRISKLIEYVKDQFTGNVQQTPQGFAMKVLGHQGGEMILKIDQPVDQRGLKGYRNFHNVLKLYKRNAKFVEVATFEERTKKIGFQLYRESDSVTKRVIFYLYLYTGINQTQTLNYLKATHGEIFINFRLVVFLPKENDQQNLDRRIKNVDTKFKPVNIFYIDDFIREKCTPTLTNEDDKINLLHITNFILPSLNNSLLNNGLINKDSDVISFIETWLKKDSDPILVIKGTGGIGKTTFAQYIVDEAISTSPKTFTFFIDSVQIKDNLVKRNKYVDQIELYSFYAALFNFEDSFEAKLTEELFRLNVDAGNILIVIDGLDEVISKIPNFNVDIFLQSIVNSSNELGSGKVIITCRTHFWNQTNYSNTDFATIELLPFNKNQTIKFFEKSFDSPNKQKNALKLAEDFKFTDANGDDVYHPYVLDIVRSIINSEQEIIELDLTSFSSKILSRDIKNDYIIYRVCDRERKRIGQISVDEQVQFFIHLANAKRGNIQTYNMKNEIEESLSKQVDLINIEAFKSHPFLQNTKDTTAFRYDFFTELFKSIYIAKFFRYSEESIKVTNYFLDTIDENCLFESSLNSEIVNRIKNWTDDDILMVSDFIDRIANDDNIKLKKKRKVIANIFNISLALNHKTKSNDIDSNTILLKSIFEKSNLEINNLSIINLVSERKVRFNFSNLKVINAYVDNYNSFYDCTFSNETKFISCYLLNIEVNNNHSRLNKSTFIDCIYDRFFENAIEQYDHKEKSDTGKAKSFLESYFHLFFSNGRLGRQWEEKVIKPRFNGIDKYNYGYKKVIRIMKRNSVVISAVEKEGIKLFIREELKEDIIRFVKDGTMSKIIADLIKDFIEK